MARLRGVSATVILLSIAAVLSSTVSAAGESSPLDDARLVDALATDVDDDSTARLVNDAAAKRAMFRSDLGKRDDDDRKIRTLRALSRSRSFKTDLGKRRTAMFRSDLGRRSVWPHDRDSTPVHVERRRAMFRSDLGKRRYPYSYTRRMFRTELGKRQMMFRHDLG